MIGPYALLIKIAAILALCAALFGYGHHKGSQSVQAKWDADKVVRLKLDLELTSARAKEITALRSEQDRKNIEVSNDHANKVKTLNAKLSAARAAVAAAGGLRFTPAASNQAGATAHGTSDSGRNADVAGTVALPQSITDDLLSLAAEADRITEVARACQAWIRKQGFYGDFSPTN
jgi:hypothetical protein